MKRGAIILWLILVSATSRAQGPQPVELGKGKVLLLGNDRFLEGDIEKVGSQYRIRRAVGELWIPADRAKKLCKDLDEVFQIMQSQANLKDADERLRLARWCHSNGLKERALQEARAADGMRPDHAETIQLVHLLQRLTFAGGVAPLPAIPVSSLPKSPTAAVRGATPLDISNDTFAQFASKVQPILLNACVSCHGNGKGGEFQLFRVSEGSHRATAQRNLASVLEFVNVEKPVLSPLLIKAVVAHGGATKSPLTGRQSVPYQSMQTWLEQMIASNPHLREIRRAEAGEMSPVFGGSTSAKRVYGGEALTIPTRPGLMPTGGTLKSGEVVSRPATRLEEKEPGLPPLSVSPLPLPPSSTPRVVPTIPSADPFDPAEFNRKK